MAANKLKTFVLQGGEDVVSSALEMENGTARLLYNYQQDYQRGYSRINGYRPLISGTLPGEGDVLGLVTHNRITYMFRNHVGGVTAGMWAATPDLWRIGSEADGDAIELRGTNILVTAGSWTEITDIYAPYPDPDDTTTLGAVATINPNGFYEFVESNFSATVAGGIGTFIGGYSTTVTADVDVKYTWLSGDIVTDDGGKSGVTPLFAGVIGDEYICKLTHTVAQKDADTPVLANWKLVEQNATDIDSSHDISGEAGKLYGVDGQNHSFEFDHTLNRIIFIDSGYDNDTPHHIEAVGNRLIVGFRAGEAAISSTLSPHNFSAVDGAGSIGVQDFLTNMTAGPEGSLYIFTKDRSYILKGIAGPLADASLAQHSKDVGAFPYTAMDIAGTTFHYDTWGITQVEVTEAFGDIVNNSISSRLQALLQGRQPVIATVSRSQAQYKLYLKSTEDAYSTVLLNTTIIDSENVGFAHSVYPFATTHATVKEYLNDQDVWDLNATHDLHVVGARELDTDGVTEIYNVYQMDVGNSFNGVAYNSYMTLPFNFLGSPHSVKQFRKMMVNVDTVDYANIEYSVDFSYGASNLPKETGDAVLNPSGGRWGTTQWNNFYWGSGYTEYLEAYINGQGENLSVTISTTSATEAPHRLVDISFVYSALRIEH